MIHLLDTNFLIYLIKNQPPPIAQRIDALPEEDNLCMSFVTWAERLKGAERSTRKTEVLRRLDDLQAMLRATGFQDIRITPKDESRDFIKDWAPGRGVEDYLLSAHIEATKLSLQG